MPSVAGDARLEQARISAALEHQRIVIALEHDRLASRQLRQRPVRHKAEIGRDRDVLFARADPVPDRVVRVVRHAEGLDRQTLDGDLAVVLVGDEKPINAVLSLEVAQTRRRYMHGRIVRARERAHAFDVVGVFVRHKQRVRLRQVYPAIVRPHPQLFERKSLIDEDRGVAVSHISAVALAAARQRAYLQFVHSNGFSPRIIVAYFLL